MQLVCCGTPLLSAPLPEDDATDLARRFKALSDPTRLRLLSLISERGDVCACDLVAPIGLSQPTVSHHLKTLWEAGLLEREQMGRWVHYRVAEETVEALRRALTQRVTSSQ